MFNLFIGFYISLGVNINKRARIQVHEMGTDNDGVLERTDRKGRCIQEFNRVMSTW